MSDPIRRADFGRVSVFFGEKSGKYPDGNQVVVRGTDTHAIFDTPLVANRIGADVDDAELVIQGHVHEDHMAGLHRVPRAPVHVHELDVEAARSWEGLSRHFGLSPEAARKMLDKALREFHYAPRPDAIAYRDGASWDLGGSTVRAIHMPGHTSGHCVLLVEPEGVAFIGDIDLSGFGPYYGDATSSLAQFRRTLARLPEVPARVWVTSHHRGIYTERPAFLEALAAFAGRIDERSDRLVELLREAPRSVDELVAIRLLYPADYEELWIDDVERRTITQHLDELAAAGRVSEVEPGRFAAA
ncbi:MBL fold metallo-hydrolase [Zeimonas arvi]|uniref:MBL fold metallo-hydrolase n=1 Tax=Zeimonas arvi TaxID=2498847 RepID=A0A5C8NVU3_9BURK|nr:MBL fold metallo-hydrolase [Zeimonas arvi]TXL65263.1 MBL fold metallo-hydrolase [Zeimonas arvi]